MAYLQDGFSTVFKVYTADAGAEIIPYLRMREVQLPEMDGGTPIDTTTMLNGSANIGTDVPGVITKAAQALVDYGDMSAQCNYDVRAYVIIVNSVVNKNRYYVVELPDGNFMAFWGCMYKFTPAPLRRGEFPLAEVKVGLLNRQGSTGVETKPYIGAGTPGSLVWPPSPRPVGFR